MPECRCKANWEASKYDANCVDQQGCEAESCSIGKGEGNTERWCRVVEFPCDAGSYYVEYGNGPSWMTCGNDTLTEQEGIK